MPFDLTLPSPRRLSRRDEVAMLRQVRDPAPDVRQRLASLYLKLMQLDEAEAVLATLPPPLADPLLWQVHNERGTDAAAHAAAAIVERLLADPALTSAKRDALRAQRAKMATRMGDTAQGEALLLELAAQTPLAETALGMIAHLPLSPELARTLLDRHAAQLFAAKADTRTVNTRILLLARAGALDQARQASGIDRFLHCQPMLPADHPLNAAAAAELAAARDLHYSAERRPGRHLQRIHGLPEKGMVAVPALLEHIGAAVRQFVADIAGGPAHEFLTARPDHAKIKSWAAIAGEQGHEKWHLHPAAWLSGTYYIAMPSQRDGNAGAIEFGWPDHPPLVSQVPSAGELVLFPSWLMHQTVPLGALARHGPRIALTFDVVPAQVAP